MNIILIGNGSLLNRGCEAILSGTLAILTLVFPKARIRNYYFSSGNGAETGLLKRSTSLPNLDHIPLPNVAPAARFTARWFLSNIGKRGGPHELGYLAYRSFQDALTRQIDSADFALRLGGDNYSLDYGFPLLHASIDQTLASKKIPAILWGASVGPFSSSPSAEKWMIKHFKKYMRLILVREAESFDYLRKIGLGEKTCAMSDPAFVMAPSRPESDIWSKEIPERSIGLNLSPLIERYRQSSKGFQAWVKDAAGLIDAIMNRFNQPLILIPHVTEPGNDDFAFMSEALNLVGDNFRNKISIVPPDLNAQELKWIISKLDILIAARTHATIAGLSSSVPTISIAYSMKAYGLNSQIFNHHDYVIHARDLTAESLIHCMETVLDRSDQIRGHLSGIIPEIQAAAFGGGEVLRSRLVV